ncbi:hypothetical protein [Alteromonas sp. ASW11-130]|uniref:hypothetical protein n=1 Tax=Alteromonas sp. ASW11-130 TaxID=3015775 RepID=UPI002241D4B6|nr:hypothetical protein [Alteromonas sp. ASW11-130]MCW8090871.1 hypothetical protein [Alteromonas sp. ASW11-130]
MKFFSLIGAAALVLSAHAQAETIEEALVKCSKVENSLERLVCFDKVVKDVKQYSGLEAAITRGYQVPNAATRSDTSPRPAPRQPLDIVESAQSATPFGLVAKEKIEEIDEITATVAKVEKAPRGKLIITMADGAIWRQTDSKNYRLKAGDIVQIERGMLGSFFLSKPDLNVRLKVKRTK